MKQQFYEFRQNNSGGSFITDDDICRRLFIEAVTAKQANNIAENLGVYFNGCDEGMDCECCGDRWSEVDSTDVVDLKNMSKAYKRQFNTIEDYAQFLADDWSWTIPEARIFYLDGTKIEINSVKDV